MPRAVPSPSSFAAAPRWRARRGAAGHSWCACACVYVCDTVYACARHAGPSPIASGPEEQPPSTCRAATRFGWGSFGGQMAQARLPPHVISTLPWLRVSHQSISRNWQRAQVKRCVRGLQSPQQFSASSWVVQTDFSESWLVLGQDRPSDLLFRPRKSAHESSIAPGTCLHFEHWQEREPLRGGRAGPRCT